MARWWILGRSDPKKLLNIILVAVMLYFYAAEYWLGDENLAADEWLVSVHYAKPWVYRQLVPMLARGLMGLGLRVDVALMIVVMGAGLGYYFALRALIATYCKVSELVPVALVLLSLLLFQDRRMDYDLMTAFLFSLGFLFLARDQPLFFLWLFPVICLNRETAILLIPVYYLWSIDPDCEGGLRRSFIK